MFLGDRYYLFFLNFYSIILPCQGRNPQLEGQILAEALMLIGLSERSAYYPSQLSGGQIQRVAIARTLVMNPSILLMDEPFAALDMETREQTQEWLLSVAEKNKKTTLLVTHQIEEALLLSDRVVTIVNQNFGQEFPVPFARPRASNTRYTNEFIKLRQSINDYLRTSK